MRFSLPFSLLTLVLLQACHNDKNCISVEVAPVISATIPDSGLVNYDISIPVTYGIANGCGRFESIEENVQGNSRTIRVMARFEGCVCTMEYATLQTSYLFRAAAAGTYYFDFEQTGNAILHDSIVIY